MWQVFCFYAEVDYHYTLTGGKICSLDGMIKGDTYFAIDAALLNTNYSN